MVESPQIPADLIEAQGAVNVDERLAVITQRVMTRENLLRIIEKYHLFEDRYQRLTTTAKTDALREHVNIEPIRIETKNRNKVTIAFKISFEDQNNNVAFRVANDLLTLFLDENIKTRTRRATETTEFLTQQADKMKMELDALENQLATYKQKHGGALPEHLELRMNMVSRTEAELKDVERERSAAQEEVRFLELQHAAAKAGVGPRPMAAAPSTPQQELNRLKAEYDKLLATYSEAHPDVRALKRKIASLESAAPSPVHSTGGAAPDESTTMEVAMIQARINAANTRVKSLDVQARQLRGRMAQYEGQIMQTPQVERGLATLMRDYESAQKKYDEMRAKQMNAQVAENLEEENKAERYSLVEPPVLADKPTKPDRVKIVLVGLLLALGGSGGVVLALEGVSQRIRGVDALSMLLGQRPLAVIPYITTAREIARRKRLIKRVAIALVAALLVSLILIQVLYMPLDILVLKIIARFG
jgi:polysaccharide chain length determinant protein (PEP-CTERM system associated)